VAESGNHVAVKREPMPMEPFAMDASPSADEVEVCPSTAKHLGTPKSGTFHEENRRPLSTDRSPTNALKLREARAIDVWLPLRRTTDLPRRIHVYEVLSLSPRKERVENRDDVRPSRRALVAPPSQKATQVLGG